MALVLAYANYADLGMGRVALREIPLALGAGEKERAEEWRFYGLLTKTLSGVIAAIFLAAYLLLKWTSIDPDLRYGLLTACLVLVESAVVVEQQLIVQTYQRFGRMTAITTAAAGMNLVGAVAGAFLAGVRGVFISQVFSFGLAAVLALVLGGLPHLRRVHWAFLWRLLKTGIPFALIAFVAYNLINIDQVMIVALLGSDALGVYMLVLYAGSALALFPNALASAVGPRLLTRYGEASDMNAIDGLTWRPVRGLSVVMPLLTIMVWVLGPWAILWLLPDFVGAIAPLRVYVVGVFFLGVNVGTSTILFALNKQWLYIPIVGGCIALNAGADVLFVSGLNMGLSGIALGSVLTYLMYWAVHTTIIRRYFGHDFMRAQALNLASGWPGFALLAVNLLAWVTGELSGPAYVFAAVLLVVTAGLTAVRWKAAGLSRRGAVRGDKGVSA